VIGPTIFVLLHPLFFRNTQQMSGGSNCVVYVGRLAPRTRERDLDEIFSKYGRITRLDVKAGYAFIEYNGTSHSDP